LILFIIVNYYIKAFGFIAKWWVWDLVFSIFFFNAYQRKKHFLLLLLIFTRGDRQWF